MVIEKFTHRDFISYKNVSRETFLRLQRYTELLKKWQKTINLVSPSTLSNVWIRHIIDSAQLIEHVSENDIVADIGSGAGFPGLVLAILGVKNMTLIESDTRKVAFLREAARVTETDIKLLNQRVENVSLRDFSLITARGFAPLKDMLDRWGNTLMSNARMLLLKGKTYRSEVQAAQSGWSFDYEIFPSITEKDAVILSLSNSSTRKLNP